MFKAIKEFFKELLFSPEYKKDGYKLKGRIITFFNEEQLDVYINMLKYSTVKEINFDYITWNKLGNWKSDKERLDFVCWFYTSLKNNPNLKEKISNNPENISTDKDILDFITHFINNYSWKI